jgi:UDP-hydrolysing UDP-N-acetyl-D-glucosamine 2-epimerase
MRNSYQFRRKICVITATRAEYGLLYWLMRRFRDDEQIELQIVVTGAHLSQAHGMTVREIEADNFTISARLPILLEDDTPQCITKSIGLATLGFADLFSQLKPDLLVLLGDRYEMLSAAQSALIARIPIAHIHGGESTEGLIDEAIRHSITKMSQLHFVAAEHFRKRLIQLGEQPSRVWDVGALGLDNIERLTLLNRDELSKKLGITFEYPSVLVTYHPVTLGNHDDGEVMKNILETVSKEAKSIIVTGVNADTGGSTLRKVLERFMCSHTKNTIFVESLGTLRYLSALKHVDLVVGNSSSGLLEAPALGTPSVDIGQRQQGRLRPPSVIHCGVKSQEIMDAIRTALSHEHTLIASRRETPYGRPGAADRILNILKDISLDSILIKHFYNIHTEAS